MEKIEGELRLLYERYGKVLIQKQELEIEIRIRNGMVLALEKEKKLATPDKGED